MIVRERQSAPLLLDVLEPGVDAAVGVTEHQARGLERLRFVGDVPHAHRRAAEEQHREGSYADEPVIAFQAAYPPLKGLRGCLSVDHPVPFSAGPAGHRIHRPRDFMTIALLCVVC